MTLFPEWQSERERIAQALWATWDQGWGNGLSPRERWLSMADRVIAELRPVPIMENQ